MIELQSAGENDEELMKSRIEVAQAAGLKHVEVIHGDETFYPMPMKDYGNLFKFIYCISLTHRE